MNKKKILFVIPSLVGGGAENALIKLLRAFNYEKYSITLLVVCYQGVYVNQVPVEVDVRYLFTNDKTVRILAYLQKKFGFIWPLKRAFLNKLDTDYDTAVSYLDSNFTDLLLFLRPKTKKVTWVHSSYVSNKNFNKFYQNEAYRQQVIRQRYSQLDTIVFVSNDAMREFTEVMGVFPDMRVVYNLFDEDDIRRKADLPILTLDEPLFTFVAVGSLIPVKGYDLLIAAASLATKQGFRFRVEIVGKGHQEAFLKNEVKRLGLEETVIFLGYQTNPFAYINRADVFVMTSVSEALPSVLCEALILGKPVLITDTPGCREVIEFGKYGMMTLRTARAFADKMMECMNDSNTVKHYTELSKLKGKEFQKNDILKDFYAIIY
ncbi:MAG: glycosyltransferase [Algoriphagus sp.]|uniref:glycosyltransferase n=1 Tax=Algoriphagus sp. TaxID=1872435 RepID=UPI00262E9FF7|nr:glycosyltransferase [Algoriphagus sp.]MDG1279046.1 glycosyltransferase [Algoriphagus sp.]